MKPTTLLSLFTVALLALPAAGESEEKKWTFDMSLYGVAAATSGDIGVGPVNANLDAQFDFTIHF